MAVKTELQANPYRWALMVVGLVGIGLGVLVLTKGAPDPEAFDPAVTIEQIIGAMVILVGAVLVSLWLTVSALLWRDED